MVSNNDNKKRISKAYMKKTTTFLPSFRHFWMSWVAFFRLQVCFRSLPPVSQSGNRAWSFHIRVQKGKKDDKHESNLVHCPCLLTSYMSGNSRDHSQCWGEWKEVQSAVRQKDLGK